MLHCSTHPLIFPTSVLEEVEASFFRCPVFVTWCSLNNPQHPPAQAAAHALEHSTQPIPVLEEVPRCLRNIPTCILHLYHPCCVPRAKSRRGHPRNLFYFILSSYLRFTCGSCTDDLLLHGFGFRDGILKKVCPLFSHDVPNHLQHGSLMRTQN